MKAAQAAVEARERNIENAVAGMDKAKRRLANLSVRESKLRTAQAAVEIRERNVDKARMEAHAFENEMLETIEEGRKALRLRKEGQQSKAKKEKDYWEESD